MLFHVYIGGTECGRCWLRRGGLISAVPIKRISPNLSYLRSPGSPFRIRFSRPHKSPDRFRLPLDWIDFSCRRVGTRSQGAVGPSGVNMKATEGTSTSLSKGIFVSACSRRSVFLVASTLKPLDEIRLSILLNVMGYKSASA